jgi:hypothetical protein
MKSKSVLLIIIILLIVILGAGGGYYMYSHSNVKTIPTPTQGEEQVAVPTIKPEDIGLTLTNIATGKFTDHGVELRITKLDAITSIDYELAYVSKGSIPRGAIGHVDVKPTDTVISQQLPFGTCSDVCHFDSDISNVKITLKITKSDGTTYQLVEPFSN